MGRRRGRLHGVEVRRRATNGSGDPRVSAEVLIRRICVRCEDGKRMCFIPEFQEEFFSQDDAYRVVGLIRSASNVLEWGIAPERDPEEGPYDTGAV
jgi:hypothetical protein